MVLNLKVEISKSELEKFVRQNKPTRFIAGYYGVSERTIYRRIAEYGLKGIRPRGPKPRVVKPKPPKRPLAWIPTKEYIDRLNETYHFFNINYPGTKYVNPQTLVFSNRRRNPIGKFTTVGIYLVGLHSEIYFLYRTGFRYSVEPVPFEEIYEWAKANAYDMLETSMLNTGIIVEDVVGFTFYEATEKPESQLRS